jgi:hypothetical protein
VALLICTFKFLVAVDTSAFCGNACMGSLLDVKHRLKRFFFFFFFNFLKKKKIEFLQNRG